MGEFVSVSSVIGKDAAAVADALATQVRAKRGVLLPEEGRDPQDDDTLILCSARGNTSVLFPANDISWWETSQALSRLLKAAVFAFHIHDSDLWMYELYKRGEKIDAFNPQPDYWMEISDDERETYRGDPRIVAGCIRGLKTADVAKYLVTWNLQDSKPGKAYPSDKHAYHDEWQLLDFMRKLGLPYPVAADGKALGPTYEFIIPPPKQI